MTMRWMIGLTSPILASMMNIGISVWADTNANTDELEERKPEVKKIVIIERDVKENKGRIKATQKTVNKIAVKLGVEPEVEDE